MILWVVNKLLLINLGWYILLALGFALAGQHPKALYFAGAAILTVGVILM